MATLVLDCPHCSAARMTFPVLASSRVEAGHGTFRSFVHLQCGGCGQPVAAEVWDGVTGSYLEQHVIAWSESLQRHGWDVIEVWPKPPQPRIPGHLPDEVTRAYLAAECNFPLKDMEDASAAMYGRALDIGTKILAPDIDKMLFGRIKELADQHRLTPGLAEWAHEIRLIRNYALHEVDGTTREELIAIRGFTEMVLTYLFTLPGMLAARKADAGAEAGANPQPPM